MKEEKNYTCKNCEKTLSFPERLTRLQAVLHKRNNPKHEVVMLIPSNTGMNVTFRRKNK